jgi:mannose-6-phosphate isomerase
MMGGGSFRLNRIVPLENPVLEYDWGSRTAIPELLGASVPAARPQAELWMGAHPLAPSRVRLGGHEVPLTQLIDAEPAAILGEHAARSFDSRLPFLFKVLAAERALSIQAHPDAAQAEEGFARENARGLSLDAAERCYRDASHKPELICALSEFEALRGFRPVSEIRGLLDRLGVSGLAPERARLDAPAEEEALRGFTGALLRMPGDRRERILSELGGAVERLRGEDPAFAWVLRLQEQHSDDLGVLAPVFLNRVQLGPGEAMFLPARELHCYLEGVALELMANSDNVLRGGLTSKYKDVDELMRVLRFRSAAVERVAPQRGAAGARVYRTPAAEFELSRIALAPGQRAGFRSHDGIEILLCVEGAARVVSPGDASAVDLPRGRSCLVPAAVGAYGLEGEGTVYRASIPR